MNIGFCFYGQPRRYKQVLPIWQNIIKSLNADVFVHTWIGQDRERVDIDINKLIEDFSPKEIQTSYPYKFKELIGEECVYENQSYHAINQSYSISKSVNLLENYSTNFNKNYDVVVKCRMDIEIINPESFVSFIKSGLSFNKIFVAKNHWESHTMFDDNIMVSNQQLIKKLSIGYFNYTIDYINKTKIIPGGEKNIYRFVESMNLLQKIEKHNSINFKLIYLPFEKIILNQNE
jgi:hypothetical protein